MRTPQVIFTIAAAACVGLGVGAFGGYALGRSQVASHWLDSEAGGIRTRIAVLKTLRGGKGAEAIEAIERDLDAHLIAVAVDGFIRKATVERLQAVMKEAAAYRETHPRTTGKAFIDDNVAARLAGRLRDR